MKKIMQCVSYLLSAVLVGFIRVYQFFSPAKRLILGPHACCKYYPSCSCYAVESIKTHGPFIGSFYAVKRIARCSPWHEGGYDPVPEKRN